MRPITFRIAMGRQGPTLDETTPDVLLALLMALHARNIEWLKHNPTPGIYTSGVRYTRERDAEDWKDIPNVLQDMEGDCEDLATWLSASLVRQGYKAVPYITYTVTPNRKRVYHIRTKVDRIDELNIPPMPSGSKGNISQLIGARVLERAPDGEWIIDPSRVLGM